MSIDIVIRIEFLSVDPNERYDTKDFDLWIRVECLVLGTLK
jgi:hypothetical protein